MYVSVPRKIKNLLRAETELTQFVFLATCGYAWHRAVGTQYIFAEWIGLGLVCVFSSSCQFRVFVFVGVRG